MSGRRGSRRASRRRSSPRRRAGGRGRGQLSVGFKLGASAFILGCFLMVAEGLSRMADPLVPTWQGDDNGGVVMVGHPSRLWGMGPGVRLNGGTSATISKLGLREPIPDVPRPEGRQRIMILGDSTFFGHGVADDQTLGAQLQDRLRDRGVDVDVINGAIPGYSTEQSLLLLDDVGWDLQPTLLLVGNLWSDNNFDHFRDVDLLRTRRRFTSGLASHSAFMRLLAGWLDRFRSDRDARVVTWMRSSELPTTGVRRVPLPDYAANLDTMARRAADHGAGFALLAPSNRDVVVTGRTEDQVWWGYFDAQERVAACRHVPRIDTLPAFRAATAAGATLDDLFLDEMHPTTRGHGVIAAAVIDDLLAAGWPTQALIAADGPCDLDDIEDPVAGGHSEEVNQLSPQTNLFPNTATPGGPQAATVPDGERLPPGAWLISGSVQAGSWPVQVTVMDTEGRPMTSTVLQRPDASLHLVVRNGLDRVTVTATDADGIAATVTVTPQAAELSLVVGEQ